MRHVGSQSWNIRINRGSPLLVWALWVRDTAHLSVPTDEIVPGLLDRTPLPPSAADSDPELGAQWLTWWRTLLEFGREYAVQQMRPPTFSGLDHAPALQALLQRTWEDAEQWRRSLSSPSDASERDVLARVIADVERSLGHPLEPVSLEIVSVPVRDDAIRVIGVGRYLVADQLLDSPAWPARFGQLVRQAAG